MASLRSKGYTTFLPLYRQKRRWSDRIMEVTLPLFPGYVFARFAIDRRQPVLMVPGVIHVVGIGREPRPIDPQEMTSLQTLVQSRLALEPWPHQHLGDRVRLTAGPLAGAEGILESVRQGGRLIVTISLLQRSVAVEVPTDDAWPTSPFERMLTAQ